MSGWCESLGTADQWHDECQRRIAAGWIKSCPCPAHANDESRYQVEPQAVNTSGRMRNAPEGASTPHPGLTDQDLSRRP